MLLVVLGFFLVPEFRALLGTPLSVLLATPAQDEDAAYNVGNGESQAAKDGENR